MSTSPVTRLCSPSAPCSEYIFAVVNGVYTVRWTFHVRLRQYTEQFGNVSKTQSKRERNENGITIARWTNVNFILAATVQGPLRINKDN